MMAGRRAADCRKPAPRGADGDAQHLALRADRPSALPGPGPACSLVLLDPPYGAGLGAPALIRARAQVWIAEGAVVAWEEASAQVPPPRFPAVRAAPLWRDLDHAAAGRRAGARPSRAEPFDPWPLT